ncbi:MAG: hypothetical protein AAGF85_20780 [Bacteroidota bacterium]
MKRIKNQSYSGLSPPIPGPIPGNRIGLEKLSCSGRHPILKPIARRDYTMR